MHWPPLRCVLHYAVHIRARATGGKKIARSDLFELLIASEYKFHFYVIFIETNFTFSFSFVSLQLNLTHSLRPSIRFEMHFPFRIDTYLLRYYFINRINCIISLDAHTDTPSPSAQCGQRTEVKYMATKHSTPTISYL